MTKEQFLDECSFAKVVSDTDGHPCLLIGGIVFKIPGLLGAQYTEWLVSALRSQGREDASEGNTAA